jgi:putative Mg2+ transporter-C (MgtC) family protein
MTVRFTTIHRPDRGVPMMMPLHPTWQDIFIRLILTMIAGAMIGFNRGARGHAAGLRTTILVALAASVAMIQTNILLSLGGKASDSFAVMDLMRLPLGILTGVGFIGGGAILKRGNAITGVTTAGTLWIVTVIGLCFGGGQLLLGAVATALGLLTLSGMEWIDARIRRERRAMLLIAVSPESPLPDLDGLMRPSGFRAHFRRQSCGEHSDEIELGFEIRWKQAEILDPSPDFLKSIGRVCRVKSFELISEDYH